MLPLERRSGLEERLDSPGTLRSVHGTLPPPVWTASLPPDDGGAATTARPLERRVGVRAREASLRARVVEARASGDPARICAACAELARWLASRDRDLDEAVDLAASALELKVDVELRRELAAWLEGLGEPARAAAVLHPLASAPDADRVDIAQVLVRVGILHARAGDAVSAAAAFDAATNVDPADPVPGELLATLAAWDPEAVPAPIAVRAYLQSAHRHAALGEAEAELLDLWRAFAIDASDVAAGRALGRALERLGRGGAADEVLRAHANALSPLDSAQAARVHAERSHAEAATRADPNGARSLATLADAVTRVAVDDATAAILERAIGVIGPRPSWCSALASAFEARGEADLAAGWSQQCVALRPGHRGDVGLLLDRLLGARDTSRLRDALAWLLTQPQPLDWAADTLGGALSALALLDPDRGLVVARRALDVLGPQPPALRQAMLAVAERAFDDSFAVAVLERWLSCDAAGAERRSVLVRLADLRMRLGDDEGAARVAARAVREGVEAPDIDRVLDELSGRSLTPEADLWRMRARAERPAPNGDHRVAQQAFRELGAALWDMADDRAGAVGAWKRAAGLVSGGHTEMALDLVAFGGIGFAFDYLRGAAESEPDDAASAAIAAGASKAALALGEAAVAFDLAVRAVGRFPASADGLEAAENAAERAGEQAALSALYERLAAHALGRYGRRAAHYRGARHFERCGEHALALKHAAQAFRAVPSEGLTLQFLARTAEHAGESRVAMHTVEQVADQEVHAPARAAWLLRAASMAGGGEEGARRSLDVLVRAAVALPSVSTVATLLAAAAELFRFAPEERDSLGLRLAPVARTIGAGVDGPEGARVAIAFVEAWVELFAVPEAAFAWLERAIACDADVDEYDKLATMAPVLAKAEKSRDRVAVLLDAAGRPHANFGVAALRLLAGISTSLSDDALRGRASVAAALIAPDDDALVIAADEAVRTAPELADRLARGVPPSRRAGALVAAARERVVAGAAGEAPPLFERAGDLLEGEARAEVERELRLALDASGRGSEIEARAYRDAAAESAAPQARADAWAQVAELREARGDRAGSVYALVESCLLDPESLERWSALERVAEVAGNDRARILALENIEPRVGPDGRGPVLKRLARTRDRCDSPEAAERAWRRVLEIDGEDEEADQAVQAIMAARGDYRELVNHLARRVERLRSGPEKREVLRAVRLRRAAILEQRLGRVEEACEELEALLREWPDSVGALRYLADLYDRQSDFARSAPLWRRAAAIEDHTSDRGDSSLRAERAVQAAGNRPASDERATLAVAARPTSDEALALRVEAARALGADADLSDALEALAERQSGDMRAQSDLLLQSARAALRAGDMSRALDRARRAAEAAPHESAAELLVRELEHRAREPFGVADAAPDVRLYDLEAAVHSAGTPSERARARLALARGRLDLGDAQGAEPLLFEALADGLVEAGDVLAPILASSPDRSPDLVRLRWQQVVLEPGELDRLVSLRAAALANGDRVHARAVEHVLRAFDPLAGPLSPPPLAAQPEQPGILPLLMRPSMDAVGEALALLWEGATELFVRDAASYGITGVERILPGPSSPIARVYEVAMRLLDVPRVPLFVTRSMGPLQLQVALLSPPSVVLSGDVRQETADVRLALGCGIAGALPHNALRQGLPPSEGRAVIAALRTAFGPPQLPQLGRQVDARVARLAESFWEIIPASVQRRLQDLLRGASAADYREIVEASLQSGRRVGMFLAGDFSCAARALLAESAASGAPAPTTANLRELCLRVPSLADLLCLAVRSEYAGARWHSAGSVAPRRTASSGRFSLL